MDDLTQRKYAHAIRAVEYRLSEGWSFTDLEDFIDEIPGLDDEQRSSLWLLALASQDTPELRALRRVVVCGYGS